MVVDPEGNFVKSYKKHFLYETDKTWAEEGPGFEAMDLKLPRADRVIRVGNGICMDINNWEFKSDYALKEFGTFHQAQGCQLILFSSAWLDPNEYKNEKELVMSTINHWADRLSPLMSETTKQPCYFICSNRIGVELGTEYVGGSCVIKLRPGKPSLIQHLSKKEQGIIVQALIV